MQADEDFAVLGFHDAFDSGAAGHRRVVEHTDLRSFHGIRDALMERGATKREF